MFTIWDAGVDIPGAKAGAKAGTKGISRKIHAGRRVRKALLLDVKGILLSLVIGSVLIYANVYYFVIMLLFLFLSITVTRYGYYEKKRVGLYEHERSWENVLSNGLVPVIAAFVSPFAYVGSVAAVCADKFASEMGVLGEDPIDLLNFKKAKRGKSGAISPFGTFMSFVGALLIGLSAVLLLNTTLADAVMFGFIGFLGSMVDSAVGIVEEKGLGNKMTTNIICSVFGMLMALIIYRV